MTTQKDLERLIRARMAKTGESYTTARSRILRTQEPPPPAGSRRPAAPTLRLSPYRSARRGQAHRRTHGRMQRVGYVTRPRPRPVVVDRRALALPALALVFALLAALMGCAGGATETVVVRDSAGVAIVENLAGSIESADAWRLSSAPVLEIGAGLDPDVVVFRVTDVAPLPDGRFAVAMNTPPRVLVFESDGVLSATLGREGEGPGEFAYVGSVVPLGADSVAVWDPDRRRISVYATNGRFIREVDLSDLAPPSTRAAPSPTMVSGITHLLPSGAGAFVVFGEGAVDPDAEPGIGRPALPSFRVSATGDRLATFGPFPGMEWGYGVSGGPLPLPLPLGARAYAAPAGDLLLVGTAETTQFRGFAPDGTLTRIVRWPDHDRTVGGPFLDRWTGFVETAQPTIRQWVELTPRRERFPAYEGMVATDDGGVMVGEYAGPVGIWPLTRADPAPEMLRPVIRTPERRWLVFDADGILAATLVMPEGFEPYAVRDDRIWGVYSDTMDVESVRAYEILHR